MSSCFPQVVNKEQSNSDNVFSFSFIPGLWELNNILLLLGVAGRLKVVKSHAEKKKNPPTSQRKTEKLHGSRSFKLKIYLKGNYLLYMKCAKP